MSVQEPHQPFARPFRSPYLPSRALLGALGSAALLLTLSACSMGAHGEAGHHGDTGDGHHDGEGATGGDHGGEGHHDGPAGRPGETAEVDRTVAVSMSDAMDYSPASVTVARGETVRFEVTNAGQLVHEFVLGTEEEILEHHEMMKRFPGMEHEEPNSVSLAAGMSGDVVWQFTEAGEVSYACLQPGHYEAGMKGAVVVGDPL